MIELIIYRLARGPATWEQLRDAAGGNTQFRAGLATKVLRKLVREGVVVEPNRRRPNEPYRLAK